MLPVNLILRDNNLNRIHIPSIRDRMIKETNDSNDFANCFDFVFWCVGRVRDDGFAFDGLAFTCDACDFTRFVVDDGVDFLVEHVGAAVDC